MGKSFQNPTIRKQISVFLPVDEWRLLRGEAARRRISMAELCRRWLCPELRRIGELERPGDECPGELGRPGRADAGNRATNPTSETSF